MPRFLKRIVRGVGRAIPGAICGALMGIPGGPAGMAAGAARGAVGGGVAGMLGVRNPIVNAAIGAGAGHFLNPANGGLGGAVGGLFGGGDQANMANGQWVNPNNPGANAFFQPGDVIGGRGGNPNFFQQAAGGLGNLFGAGAQGAAGGGGFGGLGGLAAGAALGAGAMGLMNRGINPEAAGVGVGGRNPAINAMPYLNQIPQIGQEAYNPFIQSGRQAEGMTNPIYGEMAQNPSQFLNEMQRNYTPSEGYKFKEREMTRAAQNSAAQGGFAGTRNDQMGQADLVRGLLGEDMQQYLGNVSALRQAGLQGQEGRIGRGFESAGSLADYLASNLSQQGNMVFTGEGGENLLSNQMAIQNAMNRASRRNAMLGALGNAGAGLFGMARA